MRYTDDTQMRTFKQIQFAGLLFNFFHPDENNTEESTKEVESKHPYFRRCKLGIGEARLVETKLGSKKMEEEISYSCNYLQRLFKALNKTGPNFNNLELFQNRFHSILENGRQNAIDCMTKYEKSLAKLKNKDGKDKFSNLLSSLTLPYLKVALKLKGKSDYGKKEDLINRIKACYTGGILQFGRALQANKVTDQNVNDIYESFH